MFWELYCEKDENPAWTVPVRAFRTIEPSEDHALSMAGEACMHQDVGIYTERVHTVLCKRAFAEGVTTVYIYCPPILLPCTPASTFSHSILYLLPHIQSSEKFHTP